MNADHDLHDERISRLYQMGGGPEPPAHIDAEIKDSARAATSKQKRGYVWPSLATAAVLVLSINLVLKTLNQQPLQEVTDELSTPGVRLQEGEKKTLSPVQIPEAPARMDKEEPKLERYRVMKRKAAPAPEAATDGATFSSIQKPDCSGVTLPETDSKEEWIKQYRQALEQDRPEIARCLQQAYRAKFNQAIPKVSE